MIESWPLYICIFLGAWSIVVGGVFSAFSEFVMAGLLRTTPSGGIEAMQHINRTVLKTQFVAGILLIPAFSTVFGLYSFWSLEGAARVCLILAPLVYVPCVFLITMFGNVPMNNRLDRLDAESKEAAAYWKTYVRVWTRLNHVRTAGSILTGGLYVTAAISLVTSGQP